MAKVMLVDNDPTMVSLLKILLELDGHEVLMCSVPSQVLDVVARQTPDLVLMDVFLTGGDGLALLRQMRATEAMRSLPVVMTSGMELTLECETAGASGFLLKPYTPDQLTEILQRESGSRRRPRMSARRARSSKRGWSVVDLHLHTPASSDYQETEVGYLDVLRRCEARGLDVVAFTDHNSVSGYRRMVQEIEQYELLELLGRLAPDELQRLEEYRRLRQKVLVLPGFEFTATFGFHMLAIFPSTKTVREIEHLLLTLRVPPEALDDGSSNVGATADVLTAYRTVNEAGGLVIAAHANSSNGVAMRGFNFGGQTKIAYTQDPNLHALEVTDLDARGQSRTAAFFSGTKPEYPRRMHCIQGSDAHRLRADPANKKNLGVGDRATEMLLDEPSFEAIRSAAARERLCPHPPAPPVGRGDLRLHPAGAGGRAVDHPGLPRIDDPARWQAVRDHRRCLCPGQHQRGHPVHRTGRRPGQAGARGIEPRSGGENPGEGDPQPDQPTGGLPGGRAGDAKQADPAGPGAPRRRSALRRGRQQGLRARRGRERPGGARRDRPAGPARRAPAATAAEAEEPEEPPVGAPEGLGAPRTGVEIAEVEERDGVQYYTMRDLRNGNVVKNVTKASARRLWHYAINEFSRLPADLAKATISWQGELGVVKELRRGTRVRYDLAQREAGKVRLFFGVTEDGIHGEWRRLVGAEAE